jgi:DNA sulfur modification protein DndD
VDGVVRQLIGELEEFISTRRSQAAQTLRGRLELVFQTLLHKRGLVAGASVTLEDDRVSLALSDATGQQIALETLSRGEQQVCSMAVLMALLGMAPEPFPVFLDSPFQRLDVQHIGNLVTGLAALTDCQVVLLPLPGTELSTDVRASLSEVTSDSYFIEDEGEWSVIGRGDLLTEAARGSR